MPCIAYCKIDFFSCSGKVSFNVESSVSACSYCLINGSSSSILATIRFCSASGGRGISNLLKLSEFNVIPFTAVFISVEKNVKYGNNLNKYIVVAFSVSIYGKIDIIASL